MGWKRPVKKTILRCFRSILLILRSVIFSLKKTLKIEKQENCNPRSWWIRCLHSIAAAYAIQSLLDSDYQNWEMITIGDYCTDYTESVVQSFDDSRISFSNLDQNSGQQAKPTNVALGKVRGEYITFLNQDDLFFKDHLSSCVEEIQKSGAEFMVVPGIKISPSTPQELENNSFAAEMYAVHPKGEFSLQIFSIASTWFIHHSVPKKIGLWEMEKELFVTTSQEWLFRAHSKKIPFHLPKRIGIIIIHSAERRGFYTENKSFVRSIISS